MKTEASTDRWTGSVRNVNFLNTGYTVVCYNHKCSAWYEVNIKRQTGKVSITIRTCTEE